MMVETAMVERPGAGVKPGRPAEWTTEYGLNYGLDLLLVSMPNSSNFSKKTFPHSHHRLNVWWHALPKSSSQLD